MSEEGFDRGLRVVAAGASLLLVLIAVTGCRKSASAPAGPDLSRVHGPRAYVTNEVSGDLSVIDLNTGKVLATVALGKRPRGIHASPDGSTLYIALSGSPIDGPGVDESTLPPADHSADGIGVFDVAQDRVVRTLTSGPDPENFDVSPDGKLIFVSNEDDSEASIIDIASGKVLRSFPTGAQPEGVRVTPDGKLVYVTSEENGNITVIDPVAVKVVTTFQVGHRPRSIAFTHDGKFAYVNAENDGTVTRIDTATYKIAKTIAIGQAGLVKPMGLLLSPDGTRLYVTTGRGHTLVTVDAAANAVTGSVEVGARPWGLALTPDGRSIVTANGPSNDVSVVDLATNAVVRKIPAGRGPWGLVILKR